MNSQVASVSSTTGQNTVETPQMQFFSKVVIQVHRQCGGQRCGHASGCATTGADGTDRAPNRGGSVAVRRPGHRNSCLDAEPNPSGADDSQDHRASTVATQ